VAREFGMTLIGFLWGERFNVYAGFEWVQLDKKWDRDDRDIIRV
jgi:hypothetical protein